MDELQVVGRIERVETIAIGNSIREQGRLTDQYGAGRWRKLKGLAHVRLPDGIIERAEIHWYEAHGIGRKEIKIKRILR